MVQRRGASVVTDASTDAERGIGRHLQTLVSGPRHKGGGAPDGGVTPSISMLSWTYTAAPLLRLGGAPARIPDGDRLHSVPGCHDDWTRCPAHRSPRTQPCH